MKLLESDEDLAMARWAALQVFDLIGLNSPRPFRSHVEAKALLFPVSNYTMLNEGEFRAIATAALTIGEETAYCASIDTWQEGWAATGEHREFSLHSYSEYMWKDFFLEHILYSASGKWGVLVSHRVWAIAGGPKALVDLLVSTYPSRGRDMVEVVVASWAAQLEPEGEDVYDWVFPLLVNLYDEVRARDLWRPGPSKLILPP